MPNSLLDRLSAFLLHRLGNLLSARGLENSARYCHAEARSLDPGEIETLYADAHAYWCAGDHLSARSLLATLLNMNPRHARGTNLLGAIHFAAEEFALAERLFRRAIDLDPCLAAAHNNLGNVFVERDDYPAAEPHYLAALSCDPDYVEALNNLGMVLNRRGRHGDAEKYCRRALQLKPQFAGAMNNLGSALLNQDRRGEAIECYRTALKIQPELPEAHLNLAAALNDPEHLVGTIEHYRRVLERKPDSYLAHLRLGTALQVMGDWEDSEQHLQLAKGLCPTAADVPALLGNNATFLADAERAGEQYRRALLLGAGSATFSSYIFNRLYDLGCGPAEFFRDAREWAILHAESELPPRARDSANKTERRLRIGYLSKDFAVHSVSYFIEPILAHHDRDRFEIFCYSNNPKPDGVTKIIERLPEHWRDIAFESDEKVFRQIDTDGIDILVELSGHTTGNRLHLLAKKPAPLQVSYLGYPATTGLRAIDYRIVDAITDPPGDADLLHTETLIRLPGCFLTYQPPRDSPVVAALPAAARGHVTFGSFNNPLKVNRAVVAAWARILHAVPGSRLVLKGNSFGSDSAVRRFRELFTKEGIATDRLDLLARHPEIKGHLELYGRIDIALDPFPYNGTTTTCEALWMGVPVVSLAGDRHSARVGASLISTVGLAELVSTTVDGYVDRAVRLAADPAHLASVRAGLRGRMQASPLLDAQGFTRKIEATYDTIWKCHLDRQDVDGTRAVTSSAAELCALNLPEGVSILLPASLEGMTRYVVEEQGDWVEQEGPFMRAIIGPGMSGIVIDANFGVYALALGARVGTNGRVWAFEPNPKVAAIVRRSCAENGFGQVEVVEAVMTRHSGQARLLERGDAELQQIAFDIESAGNDDRVAVMTLDDWASAAGWPPIDFIKIDAEGQEPGIAHGGERLLANQSPLVMAEYPTIDKRNDEMISVFAALAYAAWRLVPCLQVLVPVTPNDGRLADAPPLNLFFCKSDRAQALAAADRLVFPPSANAEVESGVDCTTALAGLLRMPYARPWADTWGEWTERREATPESEATGYRSAIEHYARFRNTAFTRATRWRHLSTALDILAQLGSTDSSVATRLTYARLLYDAGLAPRGSRLLAAEIPHLLEGDPELTEPLIPPCGRYERFPPSGTISNWLVAACYEQLEFATCLTGYLDPAASLRRLRDIRELGYGDAHIAERTDLIVRRFDQRSVQRKVY